MLWSTLDTPDLHILNGCSNLSMHTCTTRQRRGVTVCTMVDYIIANSIVLEMIEKITIDDYSPYTNSRNYHSHLMIQTRFGGTTQGSNLLDEEAHYCWVPGMETTKVEHTSTSDFVDGLLAVVGGKYSTTDQLNVSVEQYMLRQGILCGAVH